MTSLCNQSSRRRLCGVWGAATSQREQLNLLASGKAPVFRFPSSQIPRGLGPGECPPEHASGAPRLSQTKGKIYRASRHGSESSLLKKCQTHHGFPRKLWEPQGAQETTCEFITSEQNQDILRQKLSQFASQDLTKE